MTHEQVNLKQGNFVLPGSDCYLICCMKGLALRRFQTTWNSQARYVELFQLDAISKPDNKVIVL